MLLITQSLKWRRVKKEENLNQKGGNFANLVNRKHNLQDSIKNYHQKTQNDIFSQSYVLLEHFKGHQKQKRKAEHFKP